MQLWTKAGKVIKLALRALPVKNTKLIENPLCSLRNLWLKFSQECLKTTKINHILTSFFTFELFTLEVIKGVRYFLFPPILVHFELFTLHLIFRAKYGIIHIY